jgi:hypothetical protein
LKNSKISLLILVLLAAAMYPFGNATADYYPPQEPTEITSLSLGDTVVSGMDVVDESKIRKVPLLYNPEYLMDYINDEKTADLIYALLTGTVKTPIRKITGSAISQYGIAQGFEGPGVLAIDENKLTVNPPGIFVYGYKSAYVFGVKTKEGLKIKEGTNTIKVVPYDQISNDTVPHAHVSARSIKKWFKNSGIGERITLDYAIINFNDGRNRVTPRNIQKFFGSDVVNYMKHYPAGSPVLVYARNVTKTVIGSNRDSLGSYPEFNDAIREHNAREFVEAWNGTIIPQHTTSPGKETVRFGRSPDPRAPKGWATHGACPPARVLRDAVTQAGFGLPVGLTWDKYAIPLGVNIIDIKVRNNRNYPVKILMWTSGTGPDMGIYAKVIAFMPPVI